MAIEWGKVGSVASSTLHTAGALAFLGGLVAYIVWSRHARRGGSNADLLVFGATITYVGILANLFGGFLRTYQPGHPKFWEALDEPWAAVMVVKHAFLFAGMFAAVYLYEVVAPRLSKAIHDETPKERFAVIGTAAAILIASVLGAVAAVTPISGMAVDEPGTGGGTLPPPYLGASYPFSGTILGGPLAPLQQPQSGPFDVGQGARGLDARLSVPQGATVRLDLQAPDGQAFTATTDGTQAAPTAAIQVPMPAAGRWTYTITATSAVNAQWSLQVDIQGAYESYVEDTVTIQPGQSHAIDVRLPGGALMVWDWTSDTHLGFSIDQDGQRLFLRHVEGEAGNITAASTADFTVAWQNDEAQPITLNLRLWGDFERR